MDEIDAVGRHRGAGLGGGHDEREQTLNQLLVEMDGFETNEGVILIAATNRPDVLDPALLRPGRFDRQVVVARPDVKGREDILKVHSRRIPLAPNVALNVLARGTSGFSGADLANLVNEAALLAARQDKKTVEMMDFEKATDVARKMVCEWGMSDKMGPLTFGKAEEHVFLGREVSRPKDYSEETAIVIDSEIKRIVTDSASRAKHLLDSNLEKLHALARALLERETLDGEEIHRILA